MKIEKTVTKVLSIISAMILVTVAESGCPIIFHQPQYPRELLEEERS